MIHYIRGIVAGVFPGGVIIENGGIGYEIIMPSLSAVCSVLQGSEVTVYTAMIVREDDVSLYGFDDRKTLSLFRLLTTVSGIGAKAAVSILSSLTADEVQKAVVFNDPDTLSRAQGVGKKTAQRIVLELKDKVEGMISGSAGNAAAQATAASGGGPGDSVSEAVAALVSLGYSRSEAAEAVAACGLKDGTAEEYIRAALKKISRF